MGYNMLKIEFLSREYAVRKLTESDVDDIYRLCLGNTLFYQYCGAEPTKDQILHDLHVTPPGVSEDRKHYIGFYSEKELAAVMDLVDGYPEDEICFIGFFMVSAAVQHGGVGSGIIDETSRYLKELGKTAIRLGIDKGNPQSTSFWKKNGFEIIKEVPMSGGVILLAQRLL